MYALEHMGKARIDTRLKAVIVGSAILTAYSRYAGRKH